MPKRRRNKGNKKAAVSGGEDRLSALPEDVIRLLMSFLPSRQAVQMSVLGPHWRNRWKSLPSLRIDMGVDASKSANFVHSLLRYRDRTPLLECEILSGHGWDTNEFNPFEFNRDKFNEDFQPLLRHALSCKVKVLRIQISRCLRLSTGTIISEHLTRITLYRVEFEDFSLDVSSCQSLEELEMNRCEINVGNFDNIGIDFPKSLRLLRIKNSSFLPEEHRLFISAPGLVTLELADCSDWTPWLKSLPSLVTAFIRIKYKFFCNRCDDMPNVACCDLDDGVLLKGLSGATNLELISHRPMVFRKEIKCYPVFSKLKTLLLGDWCMTSNFHGLVYFLKQSPILERFTLQLGIDEKTETREVYKPKKQSLVLKHLKAFEITYFKKDGRVHQILNFLVYHGILPDLINIERKPYVNCFSFERKQ